VAIVRADRKASTEYLQQRLGIRYMRAADLIERMEQEGILGAPVRNGTRPILRRIPRSRIV
jgi:S-DNA-T family DNA segregation ATPase FtsK/SpoIIIE